MVRQPCANPRPGAGAADDGADLGVTEMGGQPIEDRLKSHLRAKHLLLLLDNFEQVIDAAPQIAGLLAAATSLKVLATSRATLHIYGEHEYAVPPLALPPTDDGRPTTDGHDQVDAIANTKRCD